MKAMERLDLLGAAEWTVKCNPATVSADKARLLRDWGVNRVSLGCSPSRRACWKGSEQVHSREMVFKSFDILRASGFDNVNVDLMFGIPGQTMGMWRSSLAQAAAMGPEHLACYEVIYEEDTPLFEQRRAGKVSTDEDLACAMYDELLAAAAAAGLQQYEVADFARGRAGDGAELPERACRHNVDYWRGGGFHGLGPGAAGYTGGRRTATSPTQRWYREQLERCLAALPRARAAASAGGGDRGFRAAHERGLAAGPISTTPGFDLREE